MNWELFLDESGNFKPDKPCLVGGFIVPSRPNLENVIRSWKADILQSKELLDLINECDWQFDHCAENITEKLRSENPILYQRRVRLRPQIQIPILREYTKRIKDLGGMLVIFDNPSGTYNIDNTTNYLTVFAKGMLMLYHDFPGDTIKVHAASRRNMLMGRNSPVKTLVSSPTAAPLVGEKNQGTIIKPQYKNILMNLAFLSGGQALLENGRFSEMIDQMSIIPDTYFQVDGYKTNYLDISGTYSDDKIGNFDKKSNLLTVPCDYICNSFLWLRNHTPISREEINALFSPDKCRLYLVDKPISYPGIAITEKYSDAAIIMDLISHSFDEPRTQNFINQFILHGRLTQRMAINAVIEGLKEQVKMQINMADMIARLDQTIEFAKRLERVKDQSYFIANLYLFEQNLYTHLGNKEKIEQVTQQAASLISRISNSDDRNMLLDIAGNNHIVDLTDDFDYDQAEDTFNKCETYWEQEIKIRGTENPQYPVYGKVIGSYLQVLRHRIHQGNELSSLYYDMAKELYHKYCLHMGDEPAELSRCYQVLCDIESEAGHFDDAVDFLRRSAEYYLTENADEKRVSYALSADVILKACAGKSSANAYMLQHYVRLCAMMAEKNAPDAKQLIDPLLPLLAKEPWLNGGITPIHPNTQIAWKAGSLLAWTAGSSAQQNSLSKQAVKAFEYAGKTLLAQENPIFSAIAVGIYAEEISHALNKRINPILKNISRSMKEAYQLFKALRPLGIDPFAAYLNADGSVKGTNDTQKLAKPEIYAQIARQIGY